MTGKPATTIAFPARVFWTAALAGIVGIVPMSSMAAQEPEPVRGAAGPYHVEVSVSQTSQEAHFTVAVKAPSGDAASDVTVRVVAAHAATGSEETAIAGAVGAGRYRANFEFETMGRWEPTLYVSGPLGDGTLDLPTLNLARSSGARAASYLFYGIVGAMVAGVAYLWLSSSRALRRGNV